MIQGSRRRDAIVLLGLLGLAAALRLPWLDTRGTWDADQGNEMLVLRAMVRGGVIPLLGPDTQIPGIHHGALYYYLLAPAAALTGGDSPLAIVACIALIGIVGVGATWWLARSIGGPVAGLVAGLAMAISPVAIEASTSIWNPNVTAAAGAVALAGAWHAWSTRRPVWWLLGAVGATVAMQSHALGVTLFPVLGALFVADLRRTGPAERGALARAGLGALAIVALGFLPLVVHGLTSGFTEVQGAIDFLRAGGEGADTTLVGRLPIVAARILSWPLVGLITDSPAVALIAVGGIVALTGWRAVVGIGEERVGVRWLGLGLAWATVALSVLIPSLAHVVEGLPVDHYHAFADPMVFVLLGVGVGALWRAAERGVATPSPLPAPGRILAGAIVVALVAWAGTHQPPAVAADGGFPAAEAAAARIDGGPVHDPIELGSLPSVKSADAYRYPLVRAGRIVVAATLDRAAPVGAGETLVVVCDSLFEPLIGASCGGEAEAAVVPPTFGQPLDRFKAAPRQTISVYWAPQGSVR